LGVTTAVGGGLLRDVTANEVPKIFDPRDVYAVPAFAGAFLVVLLDTFSWSNVFTTTAVAVAVFAFRILAWRFSWRVALAVQGWHR
ncbi:MAG TPA: TRIC cation channel family protein, partial [Arthrobacter sp.]|nr:TRIC cation channel family protein [Arthrobacter sp.]